MRLAPPSPISTSGPLPPVTFSVAMLSRAPGTPSFGPPSSLAAPLLSVTATASAIGYSAVSVPPCPLTTSDPPSPTSVSSDAPPVSVSLPSAPSSRTGLPAG